MRLVLVLLLTAAVAAQEQKPAPAEPPPQQPIFRAGTDLVRVDVTVMQRGDEPVADLRIADFEVSDDGEPLTTLYDLKWTRSKPELLQRIRNFEGRYGETFPVKSVIEEAQLSQRNWMELRSGVTLSALKALATQMGGFRDGRKSILFFSQGPGVRPGSPNDQLMREIEEAANRGNVTIHVIDPRPLGSVGFGGDTVLRRIAADTGGRACDY